MKRDLGPLSPDSIGGASEWSGISKYQTIDENTSRYSPNSTSQRGQLATPPVSNGSSLTMNGGYQGPLGGQLNGGNGNAPSPPASIARSSIPTSLYAGSVSGGSSGNRERSDAQFEGVLSEHYGALKRFLAAALRDEKGNPRPNKARDKLLRLSPVQFQELSTDVFDELLRRQSASRRRPSRSGMDDPGVPAYLLPKDTFHPKRNQARQKLSTLPPPRFRDLATDVFYELERRFPHFASGDGGRNGTPPMGGPSFRPDSRRRPSEASSISAYGPRSDSRNSPRDMQGNMNSPGMPPGGFGGNGSFGRPLPKTFQSNSSLPTRSTLGEDGATLDNGSERVVDNATSEEDKKRLEEYEAQVAELKGKVEELHGTLKKKDEDLVDVEAKARGATSAAAAEKKELSDLLANLENKLADAQNLEESLQSELERLRNDQGETERDLRQQLEQMRLSGGGGGGSEELENENMELRRELRLQQDLSDNVRAEAQNLLNEMKVLAEAKGASWKHERQLVNQVHHLEQEVEDWKNRYARTKTQLRGVRASSIGLHTQPQYHHDHAHQSSDGLVRDVNVTKFQISIDELLRNARSEAPEKTTELAKNVIKSVLKITKDIHESLQGQKLNDEQLRLKARVSNTCNNLFIASKNFVDAKGLSPVSLLDAAASHITMAIVALVGNVKIRQSPPREGDDEGETTIRPSAPVQMNGNGNEEPREFPLSNSPPNGVAAAPGAQGQEQAAGQPPRALAQSFMGLRQSTQSSAYSPIASPRASQQQPSHQRTDSEAHEHWRGRQRSMSGNSGTLGLGLGINGINALPPNSLHQVHSNTSHTTNENDVEDLKVRCYPLSFLSISLSYIPEAQTRNRRTPLSLLYT